MKELPNKPSELLALALEDLEKVEEDARYKINMYEWHEPNEDDGKCHVCLAGAVMAKTLEVPVNGKGIYKHQVLDKQLVALDSFRKGFIYNALDTLKIEIPEKLDNIVPIPTYEADPTAFKRELRALVKELKEHGL